MAIKLRPASGNAKQIRKLNLSSAQIRFEERVLNGAFLKIAARLPRRPEPRTSWDNRARADGRTPHPSHDAVLLARQAMHDAIETADATIILVTRLAIEAYFQQCAEAAVDVGTVLVDDVAVTEVVSSQCRALDTVVAANQDPSPSSIDQARSSLQLSLDRCGGYLRSLNTRRRADTQFGIR